MSAWARPHCAWRGAEYTQQVRDKPNIAAFVAFSTAVGTDAIDAKEAVWRRSRVRIPRWLLPYSVAMPGACTRYNHQQGQGCSNGKECGFRHVCAMCGSGTHGVFFSPDGIAFACPMHDALEKEMAKLNAELHREDAADMMNSVIASMRRIAKAQKAAVVV